MFTIKFYSSDGSRQVIKEADSFTILRDSFGEGTAEITLHQKNQADDCRIDIADDGQNSPKRSEGWPPVYGKAIIENAAGRTTEIVVLRPLLGAKVLGETEPKSTSALDHPETNPPNH